MKKIISYIKKYEILFASLCVTGIIFYIILSTFILIPFIIKTINNPLFVGLLISVILIFLFIYSFCFILFKSYKIMLDED